MKIKWPNIIFGLCLLTYFLNPVSGDARNSLNSKSEKTIRNGVLNRQVLILPQMNNLNFGVGRYKDIDYYFKKTIDKIFFQDRSIHVKVTDIEFADRNISLKLSHPVLGDGIIEFVFDKDFFAGTSDKEILHILLHSLGDENHRFVFGDPQSKIYRLFTCNHLNGSDNAIRMTREQAERQGYRKSPICFKKMVYLPEISVEMELEKNWTARLPNYETPAKGSDELQILGERILQNWPLSLMGYDYSFQLINSHRIDAFAIPTGKIVITSAFFETLENEAELEALLLLAIAHVEKRHYLKEYFEIMNSTKTTRQMKNLAMAAGSFAGGLTGGVLKAFDLLVSLDSSNVPRAIFGYPEAFENEADSLAALYFDIYGKDKKYLSSVIKKIQFHALSEQLHPEVKGQINAWRPERITRVEQTQFNYFGPQKSFVINKEARLPVQLNLIYQSILGGENRLVVYLDDKTLLLADDESNRVIGISLVVKDKNGQHEFDLVDQLATEDSWGIHLTFESEDQKTDPFLRDIETVTLKVETRMIANNRIGDPQMKRYTFSEGTLTF